MKYRMIKPAILYKNQITNGFQQYYYTDDMIYETGNMGNWFPEIAEFPDETKFQYVIVDEKAITSMILYTRL